MGTPTSLAGLEGHVLPGGGIVIDRHESVILDRAVRAPDADRSGDHAHPIWFVVAALRGMGISVDELCALARKAPDDTLLFGGVTLHQHTPLVAGGTYRTSARIGSVARKTMRDGSTLDSVEVVVEIHSDLHHVLHGSVSSTYLFKRAPVQASGEASE
jgi:hypothetical protein